MNLGDRIKKRRLELDMTLEEVGKIALVSKSTVMKWETGDIENMRRDKIILLAKALRVSPLWIMGLENTDEDIAFNTQAVPVIGTIAAGKPILAEEHIEDYFNIDSSIKADFSLRVKGDSMINVGIQEGDLVFIKKQCELENGEIGAFLIENEAALKRFYKKDNTIILQSENDKYDPIIITNGYFRILGKLVATLRIE